MPNAFIPQKHEPKLNAYCDKYYISRQLVDVAKKIGEGEEDFIIVKKVVETKQDIKEIIDSQADDVGLNNILKKFAITGDPGVLPENVTTSGTEVIDYSSMPQDLIEAGQYFDAKKKEFDSLPDDLKKGRSFTEFMSTFNQSEFDSYFNSLIEATKKVEATKKEGE